MDLKDKIQENYQLKSYAYMIVFYRRVENSERTNQICRFPIENGWVSTKMI